MKKIENEDLSTSEASNVRVRSGFTLAQLLEDIKKHLGLIIVAEAGHGKSYTAFSLVKEAMKDENLTVVVLSPSTIWRRKYGSINFVKVGTTEFNPIAEIEKATFNEIPRQIRDAVFVNLDKKYKYKKTKFLEDLIKSKTHVLFEIKYRNGRRIKAFESVVLQLIFEFQESEFEKDEEYKHHFLIVLEEAQNSFGSYSMNSDDSLELLTIFTESRSDANMHYIAIGQRLNDISTKVVERLRPLIGLTLGECSLRKIKAMIPDELKDRIQGLPPRTWLYLDGQTNPELTISEFKKEGKANQLRSQHTITKPKEKSVLSKLFDWFMSRPQEQRRPLTQEERQKLEDEENEAYEEEQDEDSDLILGEGW